MNNQNRVTLMGYYGGDKHHSLSAWVSTFEELNITLPDDIDQRVDILFEYVKTHKKREYKELLKMLASNEHHTPFEKSYIQFSVRVEQASHIHALKHRIGVSINGESARYKELKEDRFYLPHDWLDYGEVGIKWYDKLEELNTITNQLYHEALHELKQAGMSAKRAKESARFFKMMSSQIELDVSFNFRSFMHFQKLRNSSHAQKEINHIAALMLQVVRDIPGNPFQYSLKAFGY